jgi:hypothetical protein
MYKKWAEFYKNSAGMTVKGECTSVNDIMFRHGGFRHILSGLYSLLHNS